MDRDRANHPSIIKEGTVYGDSEKRSGKIYKQKEKEKRIKEPWLCLTTEWILGNNIFEDRSYYGYFI